jgi:hypothetical protein
MSILVSLVLQLKAKVAEGGNNLPYIRVSTMPGESGRGEDRDIHSLIGALS